MDEVVSLQLRQSKLRQKCVKNARNTFGGEHLLDDTEQTLPTEKNSGGINFGKDYNMITD